MLRTNSKIAKNRIDAYLTGEIAEELERWDDLDTSRPATALYAKVDHVLRESIYDRRHDIMVRFFNAPFTEYRTQCRRDLLAEWLDETEDEKNRYRDDQVERLYESLICAAWDRLIERESA